MRSSAAIRSWMTSSRACLNRWAEVGLAVGPTLSRGSPSRPFELLTRLLGFLGDFRELLPRFLRLFLDRVLAGDVLLLLGHLNELAEVIAQDLHLILGHVFRANE